jgi:hypothetical protein
VDEELQLLSKQDQWLWEFLTTGGAASYADHPKFEQVQKAVLGEVQPKSRERKASWRRSGVTSSLPAPSGGLGQRRPRRQGALVPLLFAAERQPSSQGTYFHQVTGPANYRMAGQHIRGPGCGPEVKTGLWAHQAARVSGSFNGVASQSLLQVAEGLTHWTNVEMKHRSKDWPVFDGQVIHYIA